MRQPDTCVLSSYRSQGTPLPSLSPNLHGHAVQPMLGGCVFTLGIMIASFYFYRSMKALLRFVCKVEAPFRRLHQGSILRCDAIPYDSILRVRPIQNTNTGYTTGRGYQNIKKLSVIFHYHLSRQTGMCVLSLAYRPWFMTMRDYVMKIPGV